MLHHGPRRGHRRPRPGALQVRRGVQPTQPAVEHERLERPQLLGAVDDDRHALGRVAELVDVGRDRVHAVDAEVPRRDVPTEQLGERQHEPAHARVDVAVGVDAWRRARRSPGSGRRRPAGTAGPSRRRAPCSVRRRRPWRRRRRSSRRAPAWCGRPCRTGGPTCGTRRGRSRRARSPASVTPRSMRPRSRAASTAHWIDSVPPLVRKPEAVSGPCSSPAVQPTTSDWIRPSDGNARRVERVLVQVHQRGLLGDVVDRRAAVVHEAERPALVPADVVRALGRQIGDDVVDGAAVAGQVHQRIIPLGVIAGRSAADDGLPRAQLVEATAAGRRRRCRSRPRRRPSRRARRWRRPAGLAGEVGRARAARRRPSVRVNA